MPSTDAVILDSLTDLQAAFDATVGSDGGRWRAAQNGSTVSGNTGPGTNNTLGFVYTETSGSEGIDVIEGRGILDMDSDEIPDGTNRVLNLRLAIAGDFADGTEGLEVLTREDDDDTWVQAGFMYGWAYSNDYDQGDTFDDENDVEQTVAADGGWVDFEVSIPDSAGQIQLRPHYIHGTDTQTWEHDIAFRSFSFDYDTAETLTAPSFADDTGTAQSWTAGTAITDITVPAASGNPTPTYLVVGSLPNGISFDTTTRVISGTPTIAGSGTITIRARNSEGNDNWTVAYSIASVPGSGSPSPSRPLPVATLELDFDNDGTFGHSAADVTVDLVKKSLKWTRGRTIQSRRKAVAGRLTCRLWNRAGKYDPINSSSPIFGQDISGIKVRLRFDDVTVWGGILDDIRYNRGNIPFIEVVALGALSTLRRPVSVPSQENATIGEIAKLVGAAIGIATTDLGGGKTLDRWPGVADQDALLTLHDLEETEEGLLFEQADGEVKLEADQARDTGDSAVSALELTDTLSAASDIPLLKGSQQDWGFRQISNTCHVPVRVLSESGTINLWTGSDIDVAAGATLDFLLSYPEDTSPITHIGVAAWIEPVAGTDYATQSGLTISGSASGDRYNLTISNSSASAINITVLNVRGRAIIQADPVYIVSMDASSISTFGVREYPRPAPLFTDVGQAQEYADGIVSRNKSPHGWLIGRWPAHYDRVKARTLDISRRITVTRGGELVDYYIEGISGRMLGGGFAVMEYLLSPVPGATVPSAPVVTVADVAGESEHLYVTWTEPFNGGSAITGYNIRYRKSGTSDWQSWAHSGTGRTSTITGLEEGGIGYQVQVQAENAQGDGAWSETAFGNTLSQAPSTPAAPNVMGGVERLNVSWSEPFDGGETITDYDIRYKRTTDTTWLDWEHDGTVRTATITGVYSIDDWEVQIRATNSEGTTGWSDSGTGTPTEVYELFGVRSDGELFSINRDNAVASSIGDVGTGGWGGIAGLAPDLYMLRNNQELYRVNRSTAARTLIGDTGLSNLTALAFVDGVLYAGTTTGNIYTVDVSDGSVSLVGDSGLITWADFAYIGTTLYGLESNGTLDTIDTSDGSVMLFSNVGADTWRGLAAVGDTLYVVDGFDCIYTFDPSDLSLTLVGDAGTSLVRMVGLQT